MTYFYEGLNTFDRSLIHAASHGSFVDQTPEEASELINKLGESGQQFGTRQTYKVNEVSVIILINKFKH